MAEPVITSFQDFLKSQADAKKLTPPGIAKSSGIPLPYIEALFGGEFDKLPPAPYVRGYLRTIAPIVGADAEELWRLYANEALPRTSGADDTLPLNRYAITAPRIGRFVWIAGAGVLLILYFLINGSRLLGKPMLVVTDPIEESFITDITPVIFQGVVNPGDALTVNGEAIIVGPTGTFTASSELQPGVNIIELQARRFLGRTETATYEIIYEAATTTEATTE